MTKEGDGSKSAYIAHIGGFFTFVALAGLSLIVWGLNHHCWSKKSCCFKEYHNPLNIHVFWWMSFMGLCGVLACCISGFVTSHNFSNKVKTTKCVYERIYYDSIFGEINKVNKEDYIPWEGLSNATAIIEDFKTFLIKDKDNYTFDFDNKFPGDEWELGNQSLFLDKDVYYTKELSIKLTQILQNCSKYHQVYPGSLREENGELICDSKLNNTNSLVYRYIILCASLPLLAHLIVLSTDFLA